MNFLPIKDMAAVPNLYPAMYVGVEDAHLSPPGLCSSGNTLQFIGCICFFRASLHMEWYTQSYFLCSHLSERCVFPSFSASVDEVEVNYTFRNVLLFLLWFLFCLFLLCILWDAQKHRKYERKPLIKVLHSARGQRTLDHGPISKSLVHIFCLHSLYQLIIFL